MKFQNAFLAIAAVTMSASAQAATLTEIGKANYGKLEGFREVSLEAQKLVYARYPGEMIFDVQAFRISGLETQDPLEPVKAALAKFGYEDASVTPLSDIDDQIADVISAAYSADLEGVPAETKGRMQKLVDRAGLFFDYGDTRIQVFQASGRDSNHFEASAIVVYDAKSAEVMAVASQRSE